VVFGRTSGFPATVALASLDGTDGFATGGAPAGARLGVSLAAAGDVNGDGFGDLVIGAPEAQGNGLRSGRAYLLFGRPGPVAATLSLAALTGADGVRIDGQAAGDVAGFSASGAGDVNGDGFDDVVIGAPAAAANGPYSGRAYLVFGRATPFPPVLQLSGLDGGTGVRFDGEVENDSAGQSVSGAGDVNGDGLDDLLIGAYYASHGGDYAGRTYIVFGRSTAFPASVALASLDGGTGVKIDGAADYDYSGYSVSGAGDINGDGFDDVLIGADRSATGGGTGRSHVLFGRGTGFPSTVSLAGLDGSNGFTLAGEAGDDRSGFAVSGAGDVNGDGIDDVLIGSPYALAGTGRSHVVFGRRGDSIFGNGFEN
jgi:hypothetical protein